MGAKEKKAKWQIIIASLLLVVTVFGELYTMINYSSNFIVIILLLIVALVVAYIILSGIMIMITAKDARNEERFDSIYKSEKASYLLQKKRFEEIEAKLVFLKENSTIPTEEIINAQKGIAKVIINRNKENADAIINSNVQMLERLEEIEKNILDNKDVDAKLQDIVLQMKDMELRLNQVLSQSSSVMVPNTVVEEFLEEPLEELKETAIEVGEILPEESISEELVTEESVIEEPVIEETLPMPDLSDPNKAMSSDEIAALFANMSAEPQEEEPAVEEIETPPMPDLSDPNKAMSPDEIAALFANMAAEPEAEEPVVEEIETPPMPDLSDPNKVMSPEEIAALIANL